MKMSSKTKKTAATMKTAEMTIGLDLGDVIHEACILDARGDVVERVRVGCSPEAVAKFFAQYRGARVAMETGTHANWVSRLAVAARLDVLVGNARKLRAIWASKQKSDVRDAEMLARIARVDPQLLCPVHLRGEAAQALLALLRARDQLVAARSGLVSHVRGVVKSFGARIVKCGAECFHKKAEMPDAVRDALAPVLATIGQHTETIRTYDRRIEEQVARNPDAQRLMQVPGVGALIALAFVLTIEEAGRFEKSRTVGAFVGLAPRRDQSGATDKQMHITREGDDMLRRLLVTAAHRILGPFGEDCDLREHGLRIAERGGKNAKKRAVVAVARKLAVLLHAMWKNKTDWRPHRKPKAAAADASEFSKDWKNQRRELPDTGKLAA
jgi:transposase